MKPCETCGAEPRFLMKAQTKIKRGIKDATRVQAKRIRRLEAELSAALAVLEKPPPKRTELVDLEGITDKTTQQQLIGWNMAQLTFGDLDSLVAEIRDLRRCRDERR